MKNGHKMNNLPVYAHDRFNHFKKYKIKALYSSNDDEKNSFSNSYLNSTQCDVGAVF